MRSAARCLNSYWIGELKHTAVSPKYTLTTIFPRLSSKSVRVLPAADDSRQSRVALPLLHQHPVQPPAIMALKAKTVTPAMFKIVPGTRHEKRI
jgi:hypothetical protein